MAARLQRRCVLCYSDSLGSLTAGKMSSDRLQRRVEDTWNESVTLPGNLLKIRTLELTLINYLILIHIGMLLTSLWSVPMKGQSD